MKKRTANKKLKPYLLVFFQFSTLGAIIFTGPILASGLVLSGIQILGIFLGLWSIYVMRIGNFNIIPEPLENGVLRVNGPYKVIRHPMYSSIILFALPALINHFTYWRLLIMILLLVSLYFKLTYEENRLIESFNHYKEYMKRTNRIIPFVY